MAVNQFFRTELTGLLHEKVDHFLPFHIDTNNSRTVGGFCPLGVGFSMAPNDRRLTIDLSPWLATINPFAAQSLESVTISSARHYCVYTSTAYSKATKNIRFGLTRLGLSVRYLARACPKLQTLGLDVDL
ncbi:hypothetical protein K402DRAFT_394950 [Aulographum hederae CBS 113979]|uniref:Uncharacterized protein n=1 Tax=Aulographum hederae CBS 113979 TaxID=1176131 RepID=A0A6G1GWR8_9PEZI|nr:hypothetical protein K402DRAFT_394950 [Aulographum hederae CBS 113979]